MVDNLQKEHPANSSMHYGYRNAVGVLDAPDKIPASTLYSYAQGRKYFNQLNNDVCQLQKDIKPKRKGTPLGIKILLAIGATFCGFKLVKSLIKRLHH